MMWFIQQDIKTSCILLVSKTTKELLLHWDNGKIHEDPVTVARDLRLPQFEMQKITTNRCHETNHMGMMVNAL